MKRAILNTAGFLYQHPIWFYATTAVVLTVLLAGSVFGWTEITG